MGNLSLLIIALFATIPILTIKAQENNEDIQLLNNSIVNPEEEAIKYQNIALAVIEIRIERANLPNDLLIIALEVLEHARISFDNCKTTLETNHIIWQYKTCVSAHLRIANIAITNLELEASNRNITVTSSPPPAA